MRNLSLIEDIHNFLEKKDLTQITYARILLEEAAATLKQRDRELHKLRDVMNWIHEQCPSKCGHAAGKGLEETI